MRLRASPRNLFWIITLWSVVILFCVVDKLLKGEVNLLSEQSGLRHLLTLGSARHLMLNNTSSILLEEEDTRSYIPQEGSSNVHIGDSVFNISRDVGILIYNRVPKSGSTTVNNILSDLSKRHRFSTFMSGAYASHSMPTSKEEQFASYVTAEFRQGKALLYDRHMYYIDAERYIGERSAMIPNWFNFVRHPVKRFESDYYYLRSSSRWKAYKSKPNKEWFDLTIDQCIQNNATECDFTGDKVPYRELQLTFFCGNIPECRRVGSRDALAQAMTNVERGYAFVGTTEELDLGLKVLEQLLPRFFKGVTGSSGKVKKGMVNKHAGMSSKSRQILERQMATEIEFYEFVKQRLKRMVSVFSVGPKAPQPPDVLPGFP